MADQERIDITRQNSTETLPAKVDIGEPLEAAENVVETRTFDELKSLKNVTNAMFQSIKSSLETSYPEQSANVDWAEIPSYNMADISNTDINSSFDSMFDVAGLESLLDKGYDSQAIKNYYEQTTTALDYLHDLTFFRISVYRIGSKFAKDQQPDVIKNIEQFYNKVRTKVESMQKKLALYSEPLNGFTIGYPRSIALSTEYISQANRIDSSIHSGFVSVIHDTSSLEPLEISQQVDTSLMAEVSKSKNNIFVLGGPTIASKNKITKIDSLAFFSKEHVEEAFVEQLITLLTELSSTSFADSILATNVGEEIEYTVPNSGLISVIKHDQLQANNIIKLIQDDQKSLSSQRLLAMRLRMKIADPKTDILLKAKLEFELRELIIQLESISMTIVQLQSSLESLKLSILDSLTEYNQHNIQSNPNYKPIKLPTDDLSKPRIYVAGFQVGTPITSSTRSIEDITRDINSILVSNKIYTKSFQTRHDASSKDSIAGIESGQYSGIIGLKPDRTADIGGIEESINMYFGHIEPEQFFPQQLPIGTSRRIRE
jgi:hypothetical protein